MSSGIVHNTVTSLLILPTAVSATIATNDLAVGIAAGAGTAVNLIMAPDLDQVGLTINETILPRPLRFVWACIWYPYAYLIPHRSPLSHAPLLGTAIRVLYLSSVISLALFFIDGAFETALGESLIMWLSSVDPDLLVAALVGLTIADSAHWLTDVISSARKRARRV